MSRSQASVGRIVHYVARGSLDGKYPPVCRAAIITEVDPITVCDDCEAKGENRCGDCPEDHGGPVVCLTVFNPQGLFFNDECEYDPTNTPGTWHWPERVG